MAYSQTTPRVCVKGKPMCDAGACLGKIVLLLFILSEQPSRESFRACDCHEVMGKRDSICEQFRAIDVL